MKRANGLRTLEELWDMEDRYPLTDSGATGLLRWMGATGMLREFLSSTRQPATRKTHAARGRKNRRA